MLIEKISFPEAVEMLAKKLGLVIPYQRNKDAREKTSLYEAVQKAARFFHHNLKSNSNYQPVAAYLSRRGIGKEAVDKFLIGYAPENNALLSQMRKSGFTLDVLEKASLVVSGKKGFCDLFRGRIIFPIFDTRSRIVGFGARTHKDTPGLPKYINSLENAIYSKRDHLFGLNFTREEISRQRSVIIVEGYLDMITPFMNGVKNIVASLGTALTLEQTRLIKRYASEVVLIYDSDKAGQNAALRSVDLLLENDLEVKVVRLPGGFDPDSLIRKQGREAFLNLLKEKEDFFEYKLGILKGIYDSETIDGKTRIAREIFSTLSRLNSEIKKYEYIKKLSSGLGIKEEILIAEFRNVCPGPASGAKKRHFAVSGPGKTGLDLKEDPLSVTEKILFKFMLTSPRAFSLIKKNLREEYFTSHLARKTAAFLFAAAIKETGEFRLPAVAAVSDKEISSLISKILIDDNIPQDKGVFKDSLLKLRRKGTIQLKNRLRDEIRQAEAKGDKQRVKSLLKEYEKFGKG